MHTFSEMIPEYAMNKVIGGKDADVALRTAMRDVNFDTSDYGNVTYIMGKRKDFHTFFHEYVTERWQNSTEWAYSILDACERHRYDADIEMFLEIFNGKLPEDAFLDQHVMLHKFKRCMTEIDVPHHFVQSWRSAQLTLQSNERLAAANNPPEEDPANPLKEKKKPASTVDDICAAELLSTSLILEEVRRFFHTKTSEQLQGLQEALLHDVSSINRNDDIDETTVFEWAELFSEDAEGNQMNFVESLRDQHLEEVSLFLASLADVIESSTTNGKTTAGDIRRNVLSLDPFRPEADIKAWVNNLIGKDSQATICWSETLDSKDLLAMSKTILQRRYGEPKALDCGMLSG